MNISYESYVILSQKEQLKSIGHKIFSELQVKLIEYLIDGEDHWVNQMKSDLNMTHREIANVLNSLNCKSQQELNCDLIYVHNGYFMELNVLEYFIDFDTLVETGIINESL